MRSNSSPLLKNTASQPIPLHGRAPASQHVVNSLNLPRLINFQLEVLPAPPTVAHSCCWPGASLCAAGWGLRRDSGDKTGQKSPREQQAGRRASLSEANPTYTAWSWGKSQPSEPNGPKMADTSSPTPHSPLQHCIAAPHCRLSGSLASSTFALGTQRDNKKKTTRLQGLLTGGGVM